MRDRSTCGVVVVLALASGCKSTEVDPRPDQQQARELVRASTGQADIFDPEGAPLPAEAIGAMLSDGLGLDEALRLALLDNRRLQAGFAGLGVARADFVQAGLLENPSLGIGLLFPSGGGSPKITADLAQSLTDLWELPERQAVAEVAIQRQIFELSRFAAGLLGDTTDAYYESVAADELLSTARGSASIAQAALEAVERRVQGGVATTTEENLARSQALSARVALLSAEREGVGARRRLASLLSFDGDLLDVVLTDVLPEPDLAVLDREALVKLSRSTRLDVRAARAAVQGADAQIALERRRVFPAVELSAGIERPEGGSSVDFLAGPGATLELPIFDGNRVQIRRAEFRREQLAREYEALVSDVGQRVRAAVDRAVVAARAAQFVAVELLPQAERTADLARTAYDLGDTTLLPMLEGQRAVLQARRSRVEALLEAARARVDVERTAGASTRVLAAEQAAGTEPPPGGR